MTRRRAVVALEIALALALLAESVIVYVFRYTWGVDWTTYHDAIARVLAGSPLYAAFQLAGPYPLAAASDGGGFIYPPSSLPVLLPFAVTGFAGGVAWFAGGAAVYLSGMAALVRHEWGSLRPFPLVLAVLAVMPWFAFGLQTGNVTLALIGLFAWSWVYPELAGAAAGLGFALKLAPGAFLVWAWRRCGLRAVAAFAGVAGVLALAGTVLVGPHTWIDFAAAFRNQRPVCGPGTISIACLTGLGPMAGDLVALALVALAAVVPGRLRGYTLVALALIAADADLGVRSQTFLYAVPAVTVAALRLERLRRQRDLPSARRTDRRVEVVVGVPAHDDAGLVRERVVDRAR